MTSSHHPLPASGGSYLRNEDGSLTLIDAAENEAAAAPPEAAPQPTIKRGVKAPAKEG